MDLKGFLSETKLFREAGAQDNSEILRFFDRSEMATGSQKAGLRLRYLRTPDFFRFLQFQAHRFFVFVGKDPKNVTPGAIDLVCSLSLREAYLQGERTVAGYLGDLRVHSSPRLTAAWRKSYGELLRRTSEIRELQDCAVFLTAILRENQAALRSLVHPSRDLGYRYVPVAPYRMVTLLARVPGVRNSSRGEQTVWAPARESEKDELLAFLDRCGRTRPLGFVAETELNHRLSCWPGFSLESFWIGRTRSDGSICGAFAPWSPSPFKKIQVDAFPAGASLPFLLARGLGLPVPKLGGELKVTYLTWLELEPKLSLAERRSLFREGLDAFWRSPSRNRDSLTAFCDFDSESLTPALGGYLKQETPLDLYRVEASQGDSKAWPPGTRPPGFEMALV